MSPTTRTIALLLGAAAPALGAQQQAAPAASSAASAVPIRALPTPMATSTESFGAIAAVRPLPDGRLLVNDQGRRRVLMLDSTLHTVSVVVDSGSGGENAYGARAGGLIPARGDTTFFLDPAALSMLVIDPAGKIVRVMAAPRPADAPFLIGGPLGNPALDARGRLVYRSFSRPPFVPPQPGQPFTPPASPDSAALVRFDFAARKLDTLTFVRTPKVNMQVSQDGSGGVRMTSMINPLPVVDDWSVMNDGSVAVVRGREYRMELFGADGGRTVADKIPYDWQRLSDEDKVAFIDSTRAAMERQRAAGGPGGPGGAGGPAIVVSSGSGPGSAPGGPPGVQTVTTFQVGPGGAGGAPRSVSFTPSFVSPSELPDYKPVFGTGAVRADADGRVWVRTIPTRPTPGGAVYDVIDRNGKRVDRVQVPTGTTIAGFAPGGVVFLGMRDASGIHLQRARTR